MIFKNKPKSCKSQSLCFQRNLKLVTLFISFSCKTKIESALEDLKSVIEEHLENEEFKASEEGKAAETVITEATTFLQDL